MLNSNQLFPQVNSKEIVIRIKTD
ncbi:unnamed protein product, partial [Rotaria magnacalcarata]